MGTYLSILGGSIYLSTYLPTLEEMSTSSHLFERVWPPIFLSREGWLPIYPSREGWPPIYLFWRISSTYLPTYGRKDSYLSALQKPIYRSIYLPTHLGGDGHPPNYLGGEPPLPTYLRGDCHPSADLTKDSHLSTDLQLSTYQGKDGHLSTYLGKYCHLPAYFGGFYLPIYLHMEGRPATYLFCKILSIYLVISLPI